MEKHKSGFVNIIGKPNVGKSTLMNAMLGQDLSIVTAKAQTTRHRIKGIINSDSYQVVLSDTPGIIKPAYKLQERMLDVVNETLTDADIVIYVTEIKDRKIEIMKGRNRNYCHWIQFIFPKFNSGFNYFLI